MSRFSTIILAILLAAGLTGCGAKTEPKSLQIIAMDTVMTFTAYGKGGDDALQQAGEEIRRLDALLSHTEANSAISRLNRGESMAVGEEVCDLLADSVAYAELTGGAFDVTVAPLAAAWGFATDSYQVPEEETLRELLRHVGSDCVTLTEDTVTLAPGTGIDLGGIGKGYASDRIAEVFQDNEIEQGWAALGGNVLTWGSRPDGTPWRIGIQDPAKPNDTGAYVGMLQLEDAFAVTSGSYQRFFEENGTVYHHIIDPATGYPSDSGLVSVTIVADAEVGNGTMCDALSTALFVMGEERAVEFRRSGVCDFEMILVTEDKRVVVSEGLQEFFAVEGDYVCETVS